MEFGRNFSRKKLFLTKNTFFQGTFCSLYQCQFSRKIRGTLSSPCNNNDMWQKRTFSSCIPRKMFLAKHVATPVKSTLNHCQSTLNYRREKFFGMYIIENRNLCGEMGGINFFSNIGIRGRSSSKCSFRKIQISSM